MYQQIQLKIRNKSLAAEIAIIKTQENKIKRQIRYCSKGKLVTEAVQGGVLVKGTRAVYAGSTDNAKGFIPAHVAALQSLQEHRKGLNGKQGLRRDSRLGNLAQGYAKGMSYRRIENTTRPQNEPDGAELKKLLVRFGVPVKMKQLNSWLYEPVAESEGKEKERTTEKVAA